MRQICDKIVDQLIINGSIADEDKEIYSYGLSQGLIMILNIVTTILIGAIMGMLGESIVFMLSYVPLRTFAGGYHASTPQRCYVLGMVLTISVLLLIKLLLWTGFSGWVLLIAATLIIWLLAPVADGNKPLSSQEIVAYGRKARIILSIIVSCCVLFWIIGWQVMMASTIMSLTALAVSLLLGKVIVEK